jgi:hypothetical protein
MLARDVIRSWCWAGGKMIAAGRALIAWLRALRG